MAGSGNKTAGEFPIALDLDIVDDVGKWVRPADAKTHNKALTITVSGSDVRLRREFEPGNVPDMTQTATLEAHMEARLQGTRIVGHGSESNSGGRVCDVNLLRTQ